MQALLNFFFTFFFFPSLFFSLSLFRCGFFPSFGFCTSLPFSAFDWFFNQISAAIQPSNISCGTMQLEFNFSLIWCKTQVLGYQKAARYVLPKVALQSPTYMLKKKPNWTWYLLDKELCKSSYFLSAHVQLNFPFLFLARWHNASVLSWLTVKQETNLICVYRTNSTPNWEEQIREELDSDLNKPTNTTTHKGRPFNQANWN